MQVSYSEAVAAFNALAPDRRAPSLHPAYVVTDAQRDGELEPVFFLHRDRENAFYHAFHRAPVPGTNFIDVQSPYGYGGPVASTSDAAFLAEAWAAYSDWCAEHKVLAEFIRFHPLLENWRYYQGETIAPRATVWIDLTADDLLASYRVRCRTAVRKALKEGLRVKWLEPESFRRLFPAMYTAAMAEANAGAFYLFGDNYFERLFGWDHVHSAVCMTGDQVVAAAMFLLEGTMMEYHLSASTSAGKKLSATNLILHEAATLGKAMGCRVLHLGGGTDSREDNPLLFFKSGFSERRALFKAGKIIHDPAAYAALKGQWRETHSAVSDRVLFYRH